MSAENRARILAKMNEKDAIIGHSEEKSKRRREIEAEVITASIDEIGEFIDNIARTAAALERIADALERAYPVSDGK